MHDELARGEDAEASGLAQTVVETSKAGEASAKRNYGHFKQILGEMDDVAVGVG